MNEVRFATLTLQLRKLRNCASFDPAQPAAKERFDPVRRIRIDTFVQHGGVKAIVSQHYSKEDLSRKKRQSKLQHTQHWQEILDEFDERWTDQNPAFKSINEADTSTGLLTTSDDRRLVSVPNTKQVCGGQTSAEQQITSTQPICLAEQQNYDVDASSLQETGQKKVRQRSSSGSSKTPTHIHGSQSRSLRTSRMLNTKKWRMAGIDLALVDDAYLRGMGIRSKIERKKILQCIAHLLAADVSKRNKCSASSRQQKRAHLPPPRAVRAAAP
jgi:hypothetical protein